MASITKRCCGQCELAARKPAEGSVEAEGRLGFSMGMLEHVFLVDENLTIKICGIKLELR